MHPARRQQKKKGFTIVELLIVVAIIGILAMVGIPMYKRMVQKARKAEAKVALGGLFTTETVFYSEYGAYGNQLCHIGFDLSSMYRFGQFWYSGGYYSIGFPNSFLCMNNIQPQPQAPGPIRDKIAAAHPNYYLMFATCTTYNREEAIPSIPYCLAGSVGGYGSTFLGTASGVIAPGIDPGTSFSPWIDQWSIDQNRTLINVVDGVDPR